MSLMHENRLMNQQPAQNRTAAIIAKSLQDESYRDELLANPRNAIQQHFGKELPLGLEVRVVEESANVVYVVLPPKPTVEVSDSDLEAVAGGFTIATGPIRGPRTTGWYPLDEWLTTVLM